MALEGRLSEFTLEEILQLIALQQKTGVLTVEASYPMVLYFESGELISYRDRRGSTPDPLKIYLRSYGFLSSENWEHLDFIQENSSLDLGEILVNEGHFSSEELLRIQHDVIQEHVFRGMLLRDGRYHFSSERDALQGLKSKIRVKVEGLLMEAARRIDEIAALEELFFDESIRIKRTSTPVEDLPLGERMIHLLEVLGTENTLGHVVSQGRMSYFDVLQTLDMLREENLLRILDSPVETAEITEDTTQDQRSPMVTTAALAVVILSLLAVAASWYWKPLQSYAQKPTASLEQAQQFYADQETARVTAALELYHGANGHYPKDLKSLLTPVYLGEEFPQLSRFRYERDSSHQYRLSRNDGTSITRD